jgi:hypothetical protein
MLFTCFHRNAAVVPGDPNAQLCTKYAKREYGLNDRDLEPLFCEKHVNPHYAGAAPMKLFYIRDLEVMTAAAANRSNCLACLVLNIALYLISQEPYTGMN